MLDKLRDRALCAIATSSTCTLSTTGPAGLQASVVACRVEGSQILVSIPITSDHLFNLEHGSEVVLTTHRWQLRGRIAGGDDVPLGAKHAPDQPVILVNVTPVQMHLESVDGGHRETIDFV